MSDNMQTPQDPVKDDTDLWSEGKNKSSAKDSYDNLLIVGIGASAGGLNALQKMLPGLPVKKRMAYVIAQHMAPKHQSMLDSLLAKHTDLSIEIIENGRVVKPDIVYITPPNKNVSISQGQFILSETSSFGPKPSIDYFFTTLAEEKGALAVGIILSGTGNDGAHGIRAIKLNGGITIAQDIESAKFNGMLNAAIDSESVDLILAPEKIGPALESAREYMYSLGREFDGKSHLDYINEILALIESRERVDMTGYKLSTISRRISRRAVLHKLNSLGEYLRYIKENPSELDNLFKDLLISVTSFFRDAEAFEALSEALQDMLKGKKPGDTIRVWVPASSSGEEAYSIAILISDILGLNVSMYRIQIFATDIDDNSVQRARKGFYLPATIMWPHMLRYENYFIPVDQMITVKREVRDMVIFAKQDLLKDTPFLHMDLISCRNLMIYLESNLQIKILSLFHFCLNPGGLLFLGKSESINKKPDLFSPVDSKWKLYKRKESPTNHIPSQLKSRPVNKMPSLPSPYIKSEKNELWKEREFATSLLNILNCSAIITDEQGNIIYVRGDVSTYLRLPEGSVKENINALGMARQEIRFELQSLLNRARKEKRAVTGQSIRLVEPEGTIYIRVHMGPVATSSDPQFLIVFTEIAECETLKDESNTCELQNKSASRVLELEHELVATREYLQDTVEELEAKSEELQSLNEELQSTNEEYLSSIEELGTSNEELEASNEELNTVNEELQTKSDELIKVLHGLEESEKRYRELVQNANSAIIRWKADGSISFFNEYAQTFFGYRLEEVIGKNVRILVPEIDSQGHDLSRLVNDIASNPDKFMNNVNENVCRDGRRVWMTWTNKLIFDDNGQNVEILAIGSDITEQMQAEKEAQILAQQHQIALRASNLGWWQYNPITRIASWDDRYKAIFGVNEDMLPNDEILTKIIHPDDLTALWAKVEAALNPASTEPYVAHYRIIRPDGELKWIEAHGIATFEGEGKNKRAVNFVGTVCDITERKMHELELKSSEQRLALFIENAPVSIAMFDNEMRYVCCSRRWLNDFNLGDYDIVGLSHYDLFPELPEQLKTVHQRAMKGEVLSAKCDRFERLDGSVQWLTWEVRPWCNQTGVIGGIIIFSEDITELKQAEVEREQLNEKLIQAQKMESVGRLAGGVAHDYNNMLNVIIGYTEIALEKVQQDDPMYDDLMEILQAAQRSAGVTRQLLAFARKQTVIPKEIDLNEVVDGMLKMIERLIGENIELVWMPGGELWSIKMDPSQIDQILANLCVNARSAISDFGKITIRTCNTVFDKNDCHDHVDCTPGEYVHLAVSDNGCGMDEETLNNIFEPFFTTKKVGEGTGLGLATVYGIIKQNNGFVEVCSKHGQGTVFNIYIPKYIKIVPDVAEKELKKTPQRGRETILLVEDEPSILKVTQKMLEHQGYLVFPAGNPLEAVRIAQEFNGEIDLLISDVIMPEMNGRDLADKIILIHPKLKILFMSGYTADLIAPHGILDEGVNFIEKPFSRDNLNIKVRDVLDKINE